MTGRLLVRINAALERYLPEQRLFLKSSDGTRYIRLRPLTQASVLGIGAVVVAWTVIMTSVVLIDAISGGGRDQALQEQLSFQARLNAISEERDHRAAEAAAAIERFSLAMDEVSAMQTRLLDSEERRREMETAVDVIQATLRRTLQERDQALDRAEHLQAELGQVLGDGRTIAGRTYDMERTVAFLSEALEATAEARDTAEQDAAEALIAAEQLRFDAQLASERNEQIFRQIEEAVAVGVAPLDELFQAAGMPTDRILEQVRRGYSGQGGPLTPIVMMSTQSGEPDPTYVRATEVLEELDMLNLYRLTAEQLPLNDPVAGPYRFTSPFGYRRDPIHGGTRLHAGTDFAGAQGTPIVSAGDGTVVFAGRQSGYGLMVEIRHSFGLTTRYAHLSRIRVSEGERVSRGDRIGDMGRTGRVTGVHLHYEVRQDGEPINPMTFITAGRDVF